MVSLPDEIVNKIKLYNSHPCADIIRNCDKPYDVGYLPMFTKLNSWDTHPQHNSIRYEYTLMNFQLHALGFPWGRPCVFYN